MDQYTVYVVTRDNHTNPFPNCNGMGVAKIREQMNNQAPSLVLDFVERVTIFPKQNIIRVEIFKQKEV